MKFMSLFFSSAILLAGTIDADEAGNVLAQAQLDKGLCVVLAPSGALAALPAEIASRSSLSVHVLTLDSASIESVRKAVTEKGVLGQVMSEKIGLKQLPYVDNLANLVLVCDEAALLSAGVKASEFMRVAVPGGMVINFKDDGKLRKEIKPWSDGLGDWTHPNNGADGNRVSTDSVLKMPVGLRWQDGIPMNFVRWASVRSILVAKGRCFTIGTTEMENILPNTIRGFSDQEYLVARDAFNGTLLWKLPCGSKNECMALDSRNVSPIATDGASVYAYIGGKLVSVDAKDGKILMDYPVEMPTIRLLLAESVLVSGGWENRELSKDKEVENSKGLWAPWIPNGRGCVDAFDAASGKKLWSSPISAQQLLASGGKLFVLDSEGNPVSSQQIAAFDLKSGKELWRLEGSKFAPELFAFLGGAGEGVLVVSRPRGNKYTVLSAESGSILWEAEGIKSIRGVAVPFIDGCILIGGDKHDPRTGEHKGRLRANTGDIMCTAASYTGSYAFTGKGATYTEYTKDKSIPNKVASNRGGCIEGIIPAHGNLYFAQNYCRCAPGQIPGFIALGSVEILTPEEMRAVSPVESGPGKVSAGSSPGADSWYCFLGNAGRNSSTSGTLPQNLKILWRAELENPLRTKLAPIWRSTLGACISPATISDNLLYVAAVDAGTIMAIDVRSGKEQWRFTAGGRIDSPPSIGPGLCIFGSHDGYIYALDSSDGVLVWRTRLAPWERRVMAYGEVESTWPVVGSVLIDGYICYASAGHSSDTDGGIVISALDVPNGKRQWTSVIGQGSDRLNDVLSMRDGKLLLNQIVSIDPANGKYEVPIVNFQAPKTPESEFNKRLGLEGLIDQTWPKIGNRRGGKLKAGNLIGDLVAFDSNGTCTYNINGNVSYYEKGTTKSIWDQKSSKLEQFEALALASNSVALAGWRCDNKGSASGFFRLISRDNGALLVEIPLPARPVCNGIAVAAGRVFISLEDGSVVCFGE